MIIENDVITFENRDIALLSAPYQRALATYFGERVLPEVALSNAVNAILAKAIGAAKTEQLSKLETLARAQALEKDDGKRAQVDTLISQAKAVLDVAEAAIAAASAKKSSVKSK